MAAMIFSEDNYQDFFLAENWQGKGIELIDVALHYFPVTEKNPNEGLGVTVEGIAHKDIVDQKTGDVILEKGQIAHATWWPRNLMQSNWKDLFGSLKETTTKDGKKSFVIVPKFKPTDVRYRFGIYVDDEDNVQTSIKVLAVKNGNTWIPIGDENKPRPFNQVMSSVE